MEQTRIAQNICLVLSLAQATLIIPRKYLDWFWYSDILPQARAVWYQVFSRKTPTTVYIHHINKVESPTCCLCHEQEDTLEHFTVYCGKKTTSLDNYAPPLFSQEQHWFDGTNYCHKNFSASSVA